MKLTTWIIAVIIFIQIITVSCSKKGEPTAPSLDQARPQ
jgi:hypothetical protein